MVEAMEKNLTLNHWNNPLTPSFWLQNSNTLTLSQNEWAVVKHFYVFAKNKPSKLPTEQ